MLTCLHQIYHAVIGSESHTNQYVLAYVVRVYVYVCSDTLSTYCVHFACAVNSETHAMSGTLIKAQCTKLEQQ